MGGSPGCGTLSNGRRWGEDATLLPSPQRLGRAAWDALSHPMTWAPLAGAAVLQIDDWDGRISDWAIEETPIFGSVQDAKDARGWTGSVSDFVYFASVAATPGGEEPLEWAASKASGLAVGMGARLAALTASDVLKGATGRERPDDSDDTSFPSQHAAGMSVNATLTASNLEATPMPSLLRDTLQVANFGFAAAGYWSRIEAGGHYPSDVLFGVGLGHFLGRFFEGAFLGRDDVTFDVAPIATRDTFGLGVTFRF